MTERPQGSPPEGAWGPMTGRYVYEKCPLCEGGGGVYPLSFGWGPGTPAPDDLDTRPCPLCALIVERVKSLAGLGDWVAGGFKPYSHERLTEIAFAELKTEGYL